MKLFRIVAVDLETGSVHTVVNYNPNERDPTDRLVLRQRLFRPRYGYYLTDKEKEQSVSYSYTYQLLEKVELFIVKK